MMTHPNHMRAGLILVLFFISTLTITFTTAQATTWMVGPDYATKTFRDAIRLARDGDTIGLMAGLYENDFATITQNNLTIEGIGGYAHMKATGPIPNRKAIWVIRGQNVVLRNIEFSGAHVPDRNGAGVRFERGSLIVENSFFHDNEMGLMTSRNPTATLRIVKSEFSANSQDYTATGKLSHNIYVGAIYSFTLEDSISRGARYGHAVKSRARTNIIRNNRIFDEGQNGEAAASYLVDLSNAGVAHIENNYFRRTAGAQNNVVISYGAEHQPYDDNQLIIKNNYAESINRTMYLLRNHSKVTPDFNNNELVDIKGLEAGAVKRQSFWRRVKNWIFN
ncbi:right-handed parallel beta-helix repeat-containing protein [Paremcibacter congregatus]|nr:right-handed parallel beta-helix repeat-containing protein [Paremcibacter congregatus]QDE26651.1 right-handed parallel beta-helix repeat-containing protein [Paremcibacter congregatus]